MLGYTHTQERAGEVQNTAKYKNRKQLAVDFFAETVYHTCIFQGEINGSAECANTQLSLFNRSVFGHAAADEPVLCPNTLAGIKRQAMEYTERKSYGQNWPAYTKAQVNEKAKFLELLYSLCELIDEPPQTMGRPRIPLADRIFAATFKVYSTLSGRRFTSDLREAKQRGLISSVPTYSAIYRYFESEELTPVLRRLITESAIPLKAVERDFAVDSSGFSTRNFVRWYSHKYGGGKKDAHDWLKLHIMVGVSTHVITSVEISDRDSHDTNYFRPLVTDTARNFNLREVSGDKAYASRANLRLVESFGAKPYVNFRSNTRGDSECATWNRIFHYYSFNREEYMRHYHKRSNVESAFSMIKSRFGERLRSKTVTAQTNEVLLKVLCHNLVCLVQSMYELGVEVTFSSKMTGDE